MAWFFGIGPASVFEAEGTYGFGNLAPGRYYLVAEPPVNREGPQHDDAGHAMIQTRLHTGEPGKIVLVEAGKTSNLLLTVAEPAPR